jgi:hypothetical protein
MAVALSSQLDMLSDWQIICNTQHQGSPGPMRCGGGCGRLRHTAPSTALTRPAAGLPAHCSPSTPSAPCCTPGIDRVHGTRIAAHDRAIYARRATDAAKNRGCRAPTAPSCQTEKPAWPPAARPSRPTRAAGGATSAPGHRTPACCKPGRCRVCMGDWGLS